MKRRLAGLALLWLLAATPVAADPPIWIARGPHARLILFGSVHMLPAGEAWRGARLDAALAGADEVWFELPIDVAASREAARLSRRRGLARPDDPLSRHLSPDQQARLSRVAARLGLDGAELERMRPWLADLTVSVAADAADGALAAEGVEATLQNLAPPTARRRALETAGAQIAALADAPPAEQVASLDETLREALDDGDDYARLVQAWRAGDLDALDRAALAPLRAQTPTLYARLILERNQRWARILRRRLKGRGTALVVVGVGHLIGPQGVPALLRAAGVAVEGPEADAATPPREGRDGP